MRILLFMVLMMSVGAPCMAQFKAAIIYDRPSKFDQSFSQAVHTNGVLKLRLQGIEVKEFEPARGAQIEQAMMKLAARGYQPIIGIGYSTAPAISKVAQLFPEQSFVIIDGIVDLPNVQSVIFHEEQGAFLAGALAAMKSNNDIIGFIGGMDIGLISKFSCGYIQGARYISPSIRVLKNYIGSTLNAWNDPSKAIEIAVSQIERGADVVFAAAGGSGSGVYLAAHEADILAIGVDSNQNSLQPGNMLSSMVKKVGRAVYQSVLNHHNGTWQAGKFHYGLADDWIELARDKHNRSIYQAIDLKEINIIKSMISNKELTIDVSNKQLACQ